MLKVAAIICSVTLMLAVVLPNVYGLYAMQVFALIKQQDKITRITLTNTGEVCVSSFLIKSEQGNIAFVKAKKWDRKRIDNATVTLTSSKTLEPKDQLSVLLILKGSNDVPLLKVSGSGLSICS
ncbi:MAG: hypothetical protein ACE5KA_05210 [Nitrososphaerales archaeon]